MPGAWALPDAPDRVRRPTAAASASADIEAGLFTLPNVITLARLCAVPAAVWLMLQQRLDLAFLVFVALIPGGRVLVLPVLFVLLLVLVFWAAKPRSED